MDRELAPHTSAPRVALTRHIGAAPVLAGRHDELVRSLCDVLEVLVLVLDGEGQVVVTAGPWAEFEDWCDSGSRRPGTRFDRLCENLIGDGPARDELCAAFPRVLARDLDRFVIDLRVRRGGAQRWCALQLVPNDEPEGGALIIIEDVTERRDARTALERMQRRYALATSAGGVGVWDLNLETGAMFLDTSLKSLLGYLDREIPDTLEAWSNFVHPDDLAAVEARLRDHLDGATAMYEVEHRMRHRDGGVRWFLARGMLIERRNGRPYRIVGTDADITERKRIEAAFEAEHRKYRNLFEEAGNALCELDLTATLPALAGLRASGEDLRQYYARLPAQLDELQRGAIVRHANARAAELFGRWPVQGGYQVSLVGLESGVWLDLLDAVSAGAPHFEQEATVLLPSGERRDIVLCATLPGQDAPNLVIISALDVSDRKRTQLALRASEERYGLATRAAHISVWELDRDTGDLVTDGVLHEILGLDEARRWKRAEWLGRVHPEDRARVEAYFADSALQIDPGAGDRVLGEMEYRVRHEDGGYRWVSARGRVLAGEAGGRPRVVGTTMDVTERKSSEEALRATRAAVRRRRREIRQLGNQLLVAQEAERRRIGQELHDDICQRIAALEILASEALQRQSEGRDDTLREVRRRLGELARDVRRLSHDMSAGQLEGGQLARALNTYVDELSRLAQLRVHVDLRDLPDDIPADAALCIYRVVQEALRNVARHAKADSADVQLRASGDALHVVIADDGCGFDPVLAQSSGLGLLSMKDRLHRLLGRFDVASEPGRGTRIEAWLPLRP